MDVLELIDACRDAAGGDEPTGEVSELVAAFLHQRSLPSLLGDADRSTYEALYRGQDILVLHGVVPPHARAGRARRSPDVGRHRRLPGARAQRAVRPG